MSVQFVNLGGTLDKSAPPAFADAVTLGDFFLRLADILGFFGRADDEREQRRSGRVTDAHGLDLHHVKVGAAAFVQPRDGGKL